MTVCQRPRVRVLLATCVLAFLGPIWLSSIASMARAADGGGAYADTSAQLLAIERERGIAAALARLEELSQSDPRVSGVCHAVAHDLGHAAFERAHGVVSTALRQRSDVCGGGFIHGVIERALAASRAPEHDILRVCAPRQEGICWHGIGHGAMFVTDMNVERSLNLCSRAPSSVLMHRCGEGVFMQRFNAESAGTGGSAAALPSLADTSNLCVRTRAGQQANCWFYSPNVWLAAHPDDFSGAMAWCARQVPSLGPMSCARGVGSRTVKRHPNDLTIGAAVCRAAGTLRGPCLSGMGSYWSVHWEGKVAPITVCDRLGDLRQPCRAAIRG